MRADKTPVAPVWPDLASRFLRAALSPAQIGQLPEFAHDTPRDGNPYRPANGGLL
jgi:hypothetical protein